MVRAGTADPDGRAALAELCQSYWAPVYAFYRRLGRSRADAEDLTQGLFARLLAGNDFASVARERGRFRSWLLACARHHLADVQAADQAQKRGGGQVVSLDVLAEEQRLALASSQESPEQAYARSWVRSVVERVFSRLAAEYEPRGRARVLAAARPWLLLENGDEPMRAAAAALGTSEGAFKVAVHRLRQRFHELLQAEIGQTLAGPDEVAAEMAHLLELLAGRDSRGSV